MINRELPTLDFFRFDSEKMFDIVQIRDSNILENINVYSPHILDFYLIRIIKKGNGTFFKNHIPFEFTDRTIILSAPKDIVHVDIDKRVAFDFYLIAMSNEFLGLLNIDKEMLGFGNKLLSETMLKLTYDDFDYLLQLNQLIIKENAKNPGGTKDRMITKLLETYLYFILRNFKDRKFYSTSSYNYINIYKDFIRRISEHIREKHFVADYVDLIGINEKKLNRVCKKVTGFTALQIIHKQLDQEIKHLLFYSTKSNKEISHVLGFNDTTHLYKFFKKLNNITPKQYKFKAQSVW